MEKEALEECLPQIFEDDMADGISIKGIEKPDLGFQWIEDLRSLITKSAEKERGYIDKDEALSLAKSTEFQETLFKIISMNQKAVERIELVQRVNAIDFKDENLNELIRTFTYSIESYEGDLDLIDLDIFNRLWHKDKLMIDLFEAISKQYDNKVTVSIFVRFLATFFSPG